MIDYYKILNVSMQKKKGTLTDEMVEENYRAKREQFLKMKKIKGKIENIDSDELQAILDGGYLNLLENAYYAIRSENAREHYDKLYESIEKYEKELEQTRKGEEEKIKKAKQEEQIRQAEKEEKLRKVKEEGERKLAIEEEKRKIEEEIRQSRLIIEAERIKNIGREEKRRQLLNRSQAVQVDKIEQTKNNKKEEKEEKEEKPIQKILNIIYNDGLSTRQKIEEIRKEVEKNIYSIKNSKDIDKKDIER